jgi:sterol desaturase/sphingolipid hydroxylase (fatty acid hydroxylase superfamily)
VLLALVVTGTITGLGSYIFGFLNAFGFGAGVTSGYAVYEYIHWSTHMRAPRSAYGRWTRRHHFSHHFTDARYNHGVTTPIWDMAFGTYRPAARIKVPRKFALKWLVKEDGEIRSEFSPDYYLAGRRVNPGQVIVEQGT